MKIEYSKLAQEDLFRIKEYLSESFGSENAKKCLRKITTAIRHLETFPLMGLDLGRIIDVPTDYRYLYVEKNYVVYRWEKNCIKIVRVLDERQDYMQQLFGIVPESHDSYWEE